MTSIARSYSQVRRYFENLLTCVMPPTVPLKTGTSTPPLWPVNSHLRRVLNIDKNRFIYTKLYGAFERMISTPQEGVWSISVLLSLGYHSPPLSLSRKRENTKSSVPSGASTPDRVLKTVGPSARRRSHYCPIRYGYPSWSHLVHMSIVHVIS